MAGTTATYEDHVLNTLRGIALAAWTPYIALFNGDPETDGVEIAGDTYARQAVSFGAPTDGAQGRVVSNDAAVEVPGDSTDELGPVTHIAYFTAAVGGEMRYAGPMVHSRTILPTKVLRFEIGTLLIGQE